MADLSLEILLKLLADTHGAEQVKDAMNKITGSTGDAARETHGLAEKTEELGEKQHEASEFTELLHHNHRALHQVLHVIGNESAPGMGRAMGAALMGPIGLAVAAGFAFEVFKKKIEETEKELDAFGDLAAARGKTISDSLREALVSEEFDPEKLKNYFDTIATSMTAFNAAAQHTLELQRQLRQIKLEETNKGDAMANAQDELRVKQGTMSREQADINRLNRQAAVEAAQMAAKQADSQDEIAEKVKERAKIESTIAEYQAKQVEITKSRPKTIGDINAEIATLPAGVRGRFQENAGSFDLSKATTTATEEYLKSQLEVGKNFIGEDKDGKATGLMAQRKKAEEADEPIRKELAERVKEAEANLTLAAGHGLDVAAYQKGLNEAKAAAETYEKNSQTAAVDKEIQNQRNVNFLIEEKIKALEDSITAEKELQDKIRELTDKATAAAAEIDFLKQKAANQTAGDRKIGATEAATTFAQQQAVVLGYRPANEGSSATLNEELKLMVTNHQLSQEQTLNIVKFLVGHADKMGQEYAYLAQQIQALSTRTPAHY